MYADFMGCAGDEIFNQMAKWQSMSAGILKMPIVAPGVGRLQIRRTALSGLDGAGGRTSRA